VLRVGGQVEPSLGDFEQQRAMAVTGCSLGKFAAILGELPTFICRAHGIPPARERNLDVFPKM